MSSQLLRELAPGEAKAGDVTDATLSVTRAAHVLGVHPNTIRAWSDQGRLRYYRINARGDRRYRPDDLQWFLSAAVRQADRGDDIDQPRRYAADPNLGAPSPHPLPSGSGPVAGLPFPERRLLAEIATMATGDVGPAAGLERVVELLQASHHLRAAALWEHRDGRNLLRAATGPVPGGLRELAGTYGLLGRVLAAGRPIVEDGPDLREPLVPVVAGPRTAAPVPAAGGTWGVLVAVGEPGRPPIDPELLAAVAAPLGVVLAQRALGEESERRLHRAQALHRAAADIASELDLDRLIGDLVDHAMVLFAADRGAVFLRRRDGSVVPRAARHLSETYLAAVSGSPDPSLPASAIAAARPLFATGYRNDPRAAAHRAAVVQEGFDTICCAPLRDGDGLLGLLLLYHDVPHPWPADDLDALSTLATEATVAIRTAHSFARMATWAAQLQSIQQLGARLSRLSTVREIGLAIATELRQLIDYHNVRVYRLFGDDLLPVAMQGQVGEYEDETPERLRIGLGQGITGWVAHQAVAQNLPDAARDPRAMTIPGTEDDLDESMLLAPMCYEDQVLGVLVLSKLGLHQFTDDDLRLLEIYASFAAQAMANADATERLRAQSATLERQLRSQRALLQITESILTTLDPRAIVEQITDRLGSLVRSDNVSIERFDREAGRLELLTERGVRPAGRAGTASSRGDTLAAWVIEHGDAQLSPRPAGGQEPAGAPGPEAGAGSLIVAPLRGRDGVTGVLILERHDAADSFTDEEFELVKLFAAQVSIALQNAEVHHAVEIRAQTDDLTGLLNQGTFQEWLRRSVLDGGPFSLIMLDLDEFKAVNDQMGHTAGDEMLRRLARAIVGAGRESDRVFRYGGDEFTLLLPGTDAAGACRVAKRIRAALGAVRLRSGRRTAGLTMTASVGIATFPADGTTAPAVLIAADRACYVAKRGGGNRVARAPEGLALAAEFSLQEPTPVDRPSRPA